MRMIAARAGLQVVAEQLLLERLDAPLLAAR
jgi:hypothetical protein